MIEGPTVLVSTIGMAGYSQFETRIETLPSRRKMGLSFPEATRNRFLNPPTIEGVFAIEQRQKYSPITKGADL